MRCFISLMFIFLTFYLLNVSYAGPYKYSADERSEKYDQQWNNMRDKIGTIYEIDINSPIRASFYDKPGYSNDFFVTEKEKFVIVDGLVSDYREHYWLSTNDNRPKKIDHMSNVFFEIRFESGKIAYYQTSSFRMENLGERYSGIKYFGKVSDDEMEKILSDSKKRRQAEMEAMKKKENQKKKEKKKEKKKAKPAIIETKTETKLQINE